jgi:hypothetical protein
LKPLATFDDVQERNKRLVRIKTLTFGPRQGHQGFAWVSAALTLQTRICKTLDWNLHRESAVLVVFLSPSMKIQGDFLD